MLAVRPQGLVPYYKYEGTIACAFIPIEIILRWMLDGEFSP